MRRSFQTVSERLFSEARIQDAATLCGHERDIDLFGPPTHTLLPQDVVVLNKDAGFTTLREMPSMRSIAPVPSPTDYPKGHRALLSPESPSAGLAKERVRMNQDHPDQDLQDENGQRDSGGYDQAT